MFGDIVDPSIKMGSKQGASVAMTMLIEGVVVALIVIVPLMAAAPRPQKPSRSVGTGARPPP